MDQPPDDLAWHAQTWSEHEPGLLRQATGSVGRTDAADVTQATGISFFRQLRSEVEHNVAGWLFRTLMNHILTFRRAWARRDRKHRNLASAPTRLAELGPSEFAIRDESAERIDAALARLPEDLGDLIRMVFWAPRSVSGIRRALGLSKDQYYRRLNEAYERLRPHLMDFQPGRGDR